MPTSLKKSDDRSLGICRVQRRLVYRFVLGLSLGVRLVE